MKTVERLPYEELYQRGAELINALGERQNQPYKEGEPRPEPPARREIEECRHIFSTLVEAIPTEPRALYCLANTFLLENKNAAARVFYKECLRFTPDFAEAHSNLGMAQRNLGDYQSARQHFKRAIELKPDDGHYWANLSATLVANGTPEEAVETNKKALSLMPDNGHAMWNTGLALLEMGRWAEAWPLYFKGNGEGNRDRTFRKEGCVEWDGSAGKHIVIYGEQGLGDELLFGTMLRDVIDRSASVILDAHPRLVTLFRRSFPEITVYGTRKRKELTWPFFHPEINAKLAMGSLGLFLRNSDEDFKGKGGAYLKADPILIAEMRERLDALGGRPKIGISWKGGSVRTNKNFRFIPPKDLAILLKGLDVDWISLQYHQDCEEEIKAIEEAAGIKLHHWQTILDDYDATAALLMELDLSISVPQSVVHLGGALGVPVWQLCPKRSLWQVGVYGKNSLWHDSVVNHWQTEFDNWPLLLQDVREKLIHLLQEAYVNNP